MSSVGVIWSAVARIKCLKELLELPIEAEQLLRDLEEIHVTLRSREVEAVAGVGEEELFGGLEKEIVRVSYEIVDAIVDASYKSKEMFSRRKKNATKLKELQTKLNGFHEDLKSSDSILIPTQSTKSSGIKNVAKLERRISNLELLGFKGMFSGKSRKKKNPGESTAAAAAAAAAAPPPSPPHSDTQEAEAETEAGYDFIYQKLMEELSNPSSKYSVVYLVGKGGMGKTTLTRKLYHDLQLQSPPAFNVFAWVPINHNFQIKRVLQLLLQKLGPSQEQDIRVMNEVNLIARIFASLNKNNNNNLLVLDDISALDQWESIRLALPFANSTKVIVTTSSKDFLQLPNSFQIPGLTRAEILMLLRKETESNKEIENAIFDITGGSPLFASIIGEFFLLEAAATAGHHQQQLVDELLSYKSHKGEPQVLGACYKRLAPELKPCLLYLSQFPKGHDIEVEKLYMLLMAENLIMPPNDGQQISQLQSLKHMLNELARKKLVYVQEDFKSCRLHDQVRSFCNTKGMDEELFKIVDLEGSEKVTPYTRRLAIYLSKYNGDIPIQFETSEDKLKKILSLLIFDTFESAEEKPEWPSEIHDLKEFSRARVVNFDGVDFRVRKVPRGIDKLVLLRYLSFRGCRLEELPASLSNLTQLETLDLAVHEDCKKMLIPNNIFAKMTRMMHLYFPRLYAAANGKAKVQLQDLVRLVILANFDTEACDVKDLSNFTNLEIISVISNGEINGLEEVLKFINGQGEKVQYSSLDITGFDCYDRGSASALEKLLDCKFVHSIHIEGRIGVLPSSIDNVDQITEIVLNGSELETTTRPLMDYFVRFHNLQTLVLSNDAFLGISIIIPAAPLFPNLTSMKLQKLQYLESFIIEGGSAMPKLSTLQVESCACLNMVSIPKELHDRLQKAQADKRGGVYSVMPLPSNFNIVTP